MGFDFQTASFREILSYLTAGRVIDQAKAEALRERLFAAGRINKEVAILLFDINHAVTANAGHDDAWHTLFVEALTSYVLSDPNSPNRIDESEGSWLVSRIRKDGQCDANERALLATIKSKAKFIEPSLKKLMEKNGI